MMHDDLPSRRQQYFQLSTRLAYFDNAQLQALLANSGAQTRGWGVNDVIELGAARLFVKRLPLTDRELAHFFSTKNLYALPTFYNYGVGSAGFNVFRELVTHIKTTNWVLAGEIANFPLMYHYRLLPRRGVETAVDPQKHARYVAYWNGNQDISPLVTS